VMAALQRQPTRCSPKRWQPQTRPLG